mgnify:CR=1 FL=1
MFQTMKVKGSMEPTVTVELKLVPIVPGEHVVLDDINFVGNEAKVLRSSESAMLLLTRFMQANPKVKVEIQGHVNGPTFKNKKEFIDAMAPVYARFAASPKLKDLVQRIQDTK